MNGSEHDRPRGGVRSAGVGTHGRREDPALLRGAGRFTDDLAPPEALVMEVLRSPVAAARIARLDMTAARAAPGVALVLGAGDLNLVGESEVNPLLEGVPLRPMRVLADGMIAALGQPVAVVVARNRAAALDAIELIELDTDSRPACDSVVSLGPWGNGGLPGDDLFQNATVALDHPYLATVAMEPRAVLAEVRGAGLRLHVALQTPLRVRADLARILGIDAAQLQVIAPDVGGAFGGKASIGPEEVLCALAALRLGRAVKWTATRSDEFLGATRGRGARSRARLALDGQGQMRELDATFAFRLGHWMPHSALAPARNAARMLPGPYRIAATRTCVDLVPGDSPPVNIYRGAGRPEAVMLLERAVDKAARTAGIDPLALRRRNAMPPEALPYTTPGGGRIDSGDFPGLLDRLEEVSDYHTRRARQADRRAAGAVTGLGMALYVEPCGQGWETARLTLMADGGIVADTGATAQGQGRATAFAGLLAEALDMHADQITVRAGDSAHLEDGIGAVSSRGTAIGGSAMLAAAEALRARVSGELAVLGIRGWPGWKGAVAALSQAGVLPLSVDERWTAPQEAWASGAVLAEVDIDRDTGALTLVRLDWVDDAGRLLDPVLVAGQMWGGMAQGIGAVMMERLVDDADGQLLTGSLMDYAVPRAGDMPGVVHLIARPTPCTANTLGARGVGEAGCIGVPAAVLNAAQDALLPFTDRDLALPLTSERLWRAMNGMEDLP